MTRNLTTARYLSYVLARMTQLANGERPESEDLPTRFAAVKTTALLAIADPATRAAFVGDAIDGDLLDVHPLRFTTALVLALREVTRGH
jgi:hypothetical protein